MKLSIEKINEVIGGKIYGNAFSDVIEWISVDSRSSQHSTQTLFFALVGHRHNGHQYLAELSKKGMTHFVVSQLPNSLHPEHTYLLVPDTQKALQQLAAYYRSLFSFPVIAITGSNGKTIVKEWLNFLLSPEYSIIRSPKSYNSQTGVPLSVFQMNEFHNLGIFEAGISTVSEMEKLEAILKPNVGILTNIGSAHNEGFESIRQKIVEKLKLFTHCKTLIYKKDDLVDEVIMDCFNPENIRFLNWSLQDVRADIFVKTSSIHLKETQITAIYLGNEYQFTIPFWDQASVENAISCFCMMAHLNYSQENVQQRMQELFPVNMRLQIKPGINNCLLIDDSYSCDYQSLTIALDFLEHQKQHQNKTIILSDIKQSGLPDEVLYPSIFELLTKNNIDKIIVVGGVISKYAQAYEKVKSFPNTPSLVSQIDALDLENETVLIKGARDFGFEQVVKALEYRKHETVLEVNLNAITHNLNYYRSKLKPGVGIMVMIKAFGYGSGGYELAKLLSYHHVNYLGVAFADEGISLRNSGIQTPIMVLNPEISSFYSIIQHQLEPEIYNIRGLRAFLQVAKELGVKNYPVHLKLDTGMHRLGLEKIHLAELISLIKNNSLIKIQSILSHLATSDDISFQEFTLKQIALFEEMSQTIMQELPNRPIRHIANTSGISNYPQAQFDMVRLGIGLYGVSNDAEETHLLQSVSTLKSVISQIKTIQPKESVGYGRKFIATTTITTATIPIGYADGISRALSNGLGYVLISGKPAYIVGNVCMDMIMVNVTGINCKEGDEVIIFGEQPSVSEIAQKLNTIPYEILTGISHRVKRVFFRD